MTGGGGRRSRVILGKPKKGADVAGIGARSGKQGSWRGFEGSFTIAKITLLSMFIER
jgi:hypothetical protein